MESQHLYKKILFPTDFSESSNDAIPQVMNLAKTYASALVILYTFRFNDAFLDHKNIREAKMNLEMKAAHQFKLIDEQYLQGSGLQYVFQAEVGFSSDRILFNIQEHNINLLILSTTMQKALREGYPNLLAEISCPVLVISKRCGGSDQGFEWQLLEQPILSERNKN